MKINELFVEIGGERFLLDRKGLRLFADHSWHPYRKPDGYVYLKRGLPGGRTQFFHRQLLGLAPNGGGVVDHINRDTRDNRVCNLRITDAFGNAWNRSLKDGGANPHGDKWVAQIQRNGRRIYLGLFETKESANEAYWRAHKQLMAGVPHEQVAA